MFYRIQIAALCILLAGCVTSKVSQADKITVTSTPLYRYGPAQGGQPDILPKGQIVTEVSIDSGYSIVRTIDGKTGWVDSTLLVNAPPPPKAEKIPPRENYTSIPELPEYKPDLTLPNDVVPTEEPAKVVPIEEITKEVPDPAPEQLQ